MVPCQKVVSELCWIVFQNTNIEHQEVRVDLPSTFLREVAKQTRSPMLLCPWHVLAHHLPCHDEQDPMQLFWMRSSGSWNFQRVLPETMEGLYAAAEECEDVIVTVHIVQESLPARR